MRDVNNGLIKTDGTTAFVAKGTYTGSCFDSSSGAVTAGDLVLLNDGNSNTENVTVTAGTTPTFTADIFNNITVSGSGSSTAYTGSAGFWK